MDRFNKLERERYGISREKMSELSGLTVERVRAVEDSYLDLKARGVPLDRLVANSDSERMFAVVDAVKREQDDTVMCLVGRLLANGLNVSVSAGNGPPQFTKYRAEISKTTDAGNSLSSVGNGRSPLSALMSSVDAMREVIGSVSHYFPLEPNMDAATAKDFPIAA